MALYRRFHGSFFDRYYRAGVPGNYVELFFGGPAQLNDTLEMLSMTEPQNPPGP